MNDPQIWTLIGVFAAIMLGGFTLVTTLINRTIAAGFKAVDARFEAVDAKFDAKFDSVNARFDALEFKIDHLDSDIAAIARHVWGDRRGDN